MIFYICSTLVEVNNKSIVIFYSFKKKRHTQGLNLLKPYTTLFCIVCKTKSFLRDHRLSHAYAWNYILQHGCTDKMKFC